METGGVGATGGSTTPSGGAPSGGAGVGGRGGAGTTTGGAAATGGAAPGGSAPTGGAPASGGSSSRGGGGGSAPPATGGSAGGSNGANASVLERNNHANRDGHFLQPGLTKEAVSRLALDTGFAPTFKGVVAGTPLYHEDGAGKGTFIVVTTGNDVFAFDGTTGVQLWTKNLGTPASKSGVNGCDGSNPLGVISTPVIDGATGTLYIAGATGDAAGITAHLVWALSVRDGAPVAGYPVNVSQALAFEAKNHNQRGALSKVGPIVYVPYGGHSGDCAVDLRGRVVAIDTSVSPPKVGGWQTAGQGEAIWAPAGMASAGEGVFAVTGNRLGGTGDHTDSEEVIHVHGMGTVDKAPGSKDAYFPADWKTKDQRDFDLGAVNPVLMDLPGSTGPALILTSKDGTGFIFDSADLGKGPLVTFDVSMQGMNVRAVPTAYHAGVTAFYTLAVEGAWVGCPGGVSNGAVVMAFALTPGSPVQPTVTWCKAYSLVPKGGDEGKMWGGPAAPGLISTTSDGAQDAVVWYMDGGNQLMGLDGATGSVLYKGAANACGSVRKWTSPIAVKGHIVVAADGKLCSWSPH